MSSAQQKVVVCVERSIWQLPVFATFSSTYILCCKLLQHSICFCLFIIPYQTALVHSTELGGKTQDGHACLHQTIMGDNQLANKCAVILGSI